MNRGIRTILAPIGAVVFTIMTFLMLLVGLFSGQMLMSLLLAVLFGGAALFSGLLTFRDVSDRRQNSVMSGLGQEQSRLLKLAAHQQGKLTAEEAAIECRIPVQQAEHLLEQLVNQGRADTWVSDSGSLVYVFRGLLKDEKNSAEDPMKFLES